MPPITWVAPANAAFRGALDAWCDDVGPPLVRLLPATTAAPDPLTLVSWNTHGGIADLDGLLGALQAAAGRPTRPLVLLLQEVVRRGSAVPPVRVTGRNDRSTGKPPIPSSLHGPGRGEDVGALAARLGLSLAYVPSMRNGGGSAEGASEDRGNAILSTLPLTEVTAIELPFGHQRRVAVAATVRWPDAGGHAGAALRVVSFHLDTRRSRATQADFLAAWLRREHDRGLPLVAGGDVNALWGQRDAAYVALAEALPVADCGRGRTNRWPWGAHLLLGWWRGRLDYLFATPVAAASPVAAALGVPDCVTWPDYFGSDHLPVVATFALPTP